MGQVKCEDGVSTRQHCKQHIYIYEFSWYCVSTRQRRCYRNFKTSGNQCIAMKPKILFGNSWNDHIFPFLMNIPFMKYNLRVVHPYLSRPTLTSTFQLYHGPIMLKSLFCGAKAAQHSPARVGKTCDPHPHIEHISGILGKAILYRSRDTSLQAEKKGFCVTLGQFCAVCVYK